MTLREQLHEAARQPAGINAVFDLLVSELERLCEEVRQLREQLAKQREGNKCQQ